MTKSNVSQGHVFGRIRPSAGGNNPIHISQPQEQRDRRFRPPPKPTGDQPYRLVLNSIISRADYNTIVNEGKLPFHINGDMGGIKQGMDQMLVAAGMEKDFSC